MAVYCLVPGRQQLFLLHRKRKTLDLSALKYAIAPSHWLLPRLNTAMLTLKLKGADREIEEEEK